MHKHLLCAALLCLGSMLHVTAAGPAPLDLKFTSEDGHDIDLSKMRGKVVLVDFWATWCPPCRAEVPDVVATYKKYHDKGFEVLGISLDQDEDAMRTFTQQNEMTWPQFFDGKGWDNKIASDFGIQSIPTMWLVGKDGKIITVNARDDLSGQVAQALAAP
jgi:thiol-disulfide isomerase/thioredoxin